MRGAVLYQLPFEKQNILLAPGGDISRGLELKFDLAWMRVYVCVPEEDDALDDCGYRTTLPLLGWRQLRSQLLVREPKDRGRVRDEFSCYRNSYGYNFGPSMEGMLVTIKLPPLPNPNHGCTQAIAVKDYTRSPQPPPPPSPPPSSSSPPPPPLACSDLCHTARNGLCEDGGTGSVRSGTCMFGTDCEDCGIRVWHFPPPAPAPPSPPPPLPPGFIMRQHLSEMNIEPTVYRGAPSTLLTAGAVPWVNRNYFRITNVTGELRGATLHPLKCHEMERGERAEGCRLERNVEWTLRVQPGHEVFVCFEARNDLDCDFDQGMRIYQRRSGLFTQSSTVNYIERKGLRSAQPSRLRTLKCAAKKAPENGVVTLPAPESECVMMLASKAPGTPITGPPMRAVDTTAGTGVVAAGPRTRGTPDLHLAAQAGAIVNELAQEAKSGVNQAGRPASDIAAVAEISGHQQLAEATSKAAEDRKRVEEAAAALAAAALAAAARIGEQQKDDDCLIGWRGQPGDTCMNCNCKGANLKGKSLKGIIIENSDFSGADLSDADLSSAIILEADFSGARMKTTNMMSATLADVDLGGADLTMANFEGARLNDVKLQSATAVEANLANAMAVGVNRFAQSNWRQVDLSKANLDDAQFAAVDFSHAKLLRASAKKALFDACTLENADFSASILQRSRWESSLAQGAIFDQTQAPNSSLMMTRMHSTSCARPCPAAPHIRTTHLQLTSSIFILSDLTLATFVNADLTLVKFEESNVGCITIDATAFDGPSSSAAEVTCQRPGTYFQARDTRVSDNLEVAQTIALSSNGECLGDGCSDEKPSSRMRKDTLGGINLAGGNAD